MLKSMTAFARVEHQVSGGSLTWEIRTVNHRYLEPNLKLPDNLREAEPKLRNLMRQYLSRGKLDGMLKWQANLSESQSLQLNEDVLVSIHAAHAKLGKHFDQLAAIDPLDLMQWPGVIDTQARNQQLLVEGAVEAFETCLKILHENRLREGSQLAPLFETRLSEMSDIVSSVRQALPEILQKQREQILKRFQEVSIDLNNERLEQEMVLLAQKTDVAEELDRLDAHVVEVRNVLKKNEPVGRRLDFLMQELNREANTLSSKSIVTDTTKAAVDLKVLIEQMREQVQNIE
ncbi:MAG: YicC/YloC family endoribonuclease [Oleiphilus sp.]